jgi:hypothetical protein
MRQILFNAFIVLCLLVPANLAAGNLDPDKDIISPLTVTLTKYRERGYDVRGPLQYLGKEDGRILLYRHDPVSYKRLDIFNELGNAWMVRKHNFVYILSKDGHVVIIRLNRKENTDA